MTPRMSGPENEWSMFSNQNTSTKWVNIAPSETRMALIETYQSQLLIGGTLVSNGAVLTYFVTIF